MFWVCTLRFWAIHNILLFSPQPAQDEQRWLGKNWPIFVVEFCSSNCNQTMWKNLSKYYVCGSRISKLWFGNKQTVYSFYAFFLYKNFSFLIFQTINNASIQVQNTFCIIQQFCPLGQRAFQGYFVNDNPAMICRYICETVNWKECKTWTYNSEARQCHVRTYLSEAQIKSHHASGVKCSEPEQQVMSPIRFWIIVVCAVLLSLIFSGLFFTHLNDFCDQRFQAQRIEGLKE